MAIDTYTDSGNWSQSSDKQFPEGMDKPLTKRTLTVSIGATGTAIFSGIIDNASVGEYNNDFFWRDKVLIYDEMLRGDGIVAGTRRAIEQPITSAKWTVEPFSNSAQDTEIASFVQSCLMEGLCYTTAAGVEQYQSWSEVLRQIQMHLWYGFMVFEIVWKVEDGFIKPARLTPLMPDTVWRWFVDKGTDLVAVQQRVWKDYGYRFVNIPVTKLLRFANQQEGNNYEGISLLRSMYKHWFYAQGFEKIQAIGIERDAVATPLMKMTADASGADVQAAELLVKNMRAHEEMGGTIPPGFDVEYPANHLLMTDVVQAAIEGHHESMVRSVLANFMMSGTTKYGGRGTDESQTARFYQAYQAVADYEADVMNNQLVKQLVDLNYDRVEGYPKVHCSKLVAQDIQALAQAMQQLSQGNQPILHIGPQDEDQIRDSLGLPGAPMNVIESTDPSSPANPEQPDAGANPYAGSGTDINNTTSTPRGQQNTAAADDAGDGMSELADNVRLLAETYGAIMAQDAVRQALDHEQAVKLYNPYHRGTGSGGGQFTRKGTAGASAPSAGRSGSGHGGGSTRGRSSGRSGGSSEHESRSGTHGGAGRSRGGSGGGSGSHASRGAKGEHESTGRSGHGKAEGESKSVGGHGSRGGKSQESGRITPVKQVDSGRFPTYGAPHPAAILEAYGRGQMPQVLSRYSSSDLHKMVGMLQQEHPGTGPAGRKKSDAIEYITHHTTMHNADQIKEEIARAGAPRGMHAFVTHSAKSEGESTSHSTSRRSSTPKSDEELNGGHHVMTAKERADAGLKAESKAGEKLTIEQYRSLDYHGNHSPPPGKLEVEERLFTYGEHQLGNSLTSMPRGELQLAAREYGLKSGGTKEDLVARITQHVTEGRYSGRFPKSESSAPKAARGSASKGSSSRSKSTEDQIKELEGRIAALKSGRGEGASTKGGSTRSRTSTSKRSGDEPTARSGSARGNGKTSAKSGEEEMTKSASRGRGKAAQQREPQPISQHRGTPAENHDREVARLTTKLPKLTGSDKQVSWATNVRQTLLREAAASLRGYRRSSVASLHSKPDRENYNLAKAAYRRMLARTDARYWIDARNAHGSGLLSKEMDAVDEEGA